MAAPAASRRVRVVLADDDGLFRRLLRLAFERAGMEVVGEAGTGVETELLAARLRPDLIILDVQMPGRDGLQTLPLLRASVADARVVVYSGHDDPAVERDALELGAAAFVSKHISPQALVQRIVRGELTSDAPAGRHNTGAGSG